MYGMRKAGPVIATGGRHLRQDSDNEDHPGLSAGRILCHEFETSRLTYRASVCLRSRRIGDCRVSDRGGPRYAIK